jgi:hypothetical protein
MQIIKHIIIILGQMILEIFTAIKLGFLGQLTIREMPKVLILSDWIALGLIIFIGLLLVIIAGILFGELRDVFNINIINTFGSKVYTIINAIGTPLHELSHLVVAIIFRHRINSFALFSPKRAKIDNTLGYVNHSYNKKSLYQKAGNFPIGVAPMFLMPALLILLFYFNEPSVTNSITSLGFENATVVNVIKSIGANFKFNILTIPLLLLTICFASNMTISKPDIVGAKSGIFSVIIIMTIILSITEGLGWGNIAIYINSSFKIINYFAIFSLLNIILFMILIFISYIAKKFCRIVTI